MLPFGREECCVYSAVAWIDSELAVLDAVHRVSVQAHDTCQCSSSSAHVVEIRCNAGLLVVRSKTL